MNTPHFEIEHHPSGMVLSPLQVAPVIITVQHNGMSPKPFDGLFETRKNGSWESDMRTAEMAKAIFIQAMPYVSVVWNTMPRKFLETNCEPGIEAYEDKKMKMYFDDFHGVIESLVEKASMRFTQEQIFIFDLHVFESQPPYAPQHGYDVILGTRNRETVLGNVINKTNQGHSDVSPNSDVDHILAKYLENCGAHVFLPQEEQVGERPDWFNGGYLVHRHFSSGLIAAAIQIEVAHYLNYGDERMTHAQKNMRSGIIDSTSLMIKEFFGG